MDWLIDRLESAGDKLAFIHEDREVSYKQVVTTINQFRLEIQSHGISSGARVVVLGDYSPEVFCMIMALALENCVIVPLTPSSVVEESSALSICGCDWYVEFDELGGEPAFARRSVDAENDMLTRFCAQKRPGLVLFSSGSTGAPKGILHDLNKVAEKFRVTRGATRAIPFLMIDHFGGINTILAITSGLGVVVTVSDRSVASICGAIEKYKVELLPATPSFLTLMIASNLHKKYDLSSLKRITYGTEVMPQSMLSHLRAKFPQVDFLQTYGLSEVGVLRSRSRPDGSLWVRIGGDGFQTKVVDHVLWIKSDFAMVGYLNAPQPFDEHGWFNTQDRVEVDGEYFRILGRESDLINVGGQKVYPAEVENVILEIPNVEDVAVYGETHPMLGQVVVAKISLIEPEAIDSLKKRVRQACKEKLLPFKVPTKVMISDEPLYSARQKKLRK